MSHLARLLMGSVGKAEEVSGQYESMLSRSQFIDWAVPEGVYSISVVMIETGGDGARGQAGRRCPSISSARGSGGLGGLGGFCSYLNNISVTPGQVIRVRSVNSGGRDSSIVSFGSIFDTRAGGLSLGRAGSGSTGEAGAAFTPQDGVGPTGKKGAWGRGFDTKTLTLTGAGAGAGYGGGGGGGGGGTYDPGVSSCVSLGSAGAPSDGLSGGPGFIRIIWPGHSRQFPSTRTQDE